MNENGQFIEERELYQLKTMDILVDVQLLCLILGGYLVVPFWFRGFAGSLSGQALNSAYDPALHQLPLPRAGSISHAFASPMMSRGLPEGAPPGLETEVRVAGPPPTALEWLVLP